MPGLDFNSAASQYASGAGTGLTTDTAGTIAGWCKPETLHAGVVFNLSSTSSANRYIVVHLQADGKILVRHQKPTADYILWSRRTDDVQYAAGDLLHLALTHNGTAPVLYVNGISVAITPTATEDDPTAWINDILYFDSTYGKVGIGAHVGSAPDTFFNGIVYDAAYWSAALSAADILWLYGPGSPIFRRPMALGTTPTRFFDFSEGTGTNAADTSGQGYDLTLVNTPTWIGNDGTMIFPRRRRILCGA